ncbi:MAG: response regulator [Oligoflexus sp.]
MFTKPFKLVIVDDQEDIGIILEHFIHDSYPDQIHVETFISSDKALEYITGNDVTIVISDLELPGLHGLDLIQKINQMNRGIQTIVITGHQSYSNALECFMSGVQGYITKPLTQNQLKSAIDQCIRRLAYWERILNHVEAI